MDPMEILLRLVVCLFTQAELAVGEGVRQDAWNKFKPVVKKIYYSTKSYFSSDSSTAKTFDLFETNPTDKEAQELIKEYFSKFNELNLDFKREVTQLINEIKKHEDIYLFIRNVEHFTYININSTKDGDLGLPLLINDEKKAEELLICQLLKGTYTPTNILDSKFQMVKSYIPFYFVCGQYSAFLKYTAVFHENEEYDDTVKQLNNKREYETVTVRKSRLVDKDYPRENRIEATSFEELIVAGDIAEFLEQYNDSIIKAISKFLERPKICETDLKLLEIDDSFKSLITLDKMEADKIVHRRIYNYIHNQIYRNLDGDRQKNMDLKPPAIVKNCFKKIYLPYWFLKYCYNTKYYVIVMDGWNSSSFFDDFKPKDITKREDTLEFFKIIFVPIVIAYIVSGIVNSYLNQIYIFTTWDMVAITLLIGIPWMYKFYIERRDRIKKSKEIRENIFYRYKGGSLQLNYDS